MKTKKLSKSSISDSQQFGRITAEFGFVYNPNCTILYSYPLNNEPKKFVSQFCKGHALGKIGDDLYSIVQKILAEPSDLEAISNLNDEVDNFFSMLMSTIVKYSDFEVFVATFGGYYVYLKTILNQVPINMDLFCRIVFDEKEKTVLGSCTPIIPIEGRMGEFRQVIADLS